MVGKQSQVGEDLLNLLPLKKFANVGSGKQKRQTLKQQLSFPFSQAQLDLLPDSFPLPCYHYKLHPVQVPSERKQVAQKGC